MRAYKGFTPNPDGTLQCLSKTYREGETYTEPSAELCSHGMHACLYLIATGRSDGLPHLDRHNEGEDQ